MGKRGWALAGLVLAAALPGATPARADPGENRALETQCRKGERAACVTLGKRLADIYDPRADRPRALALLRPVCDSPATIAEAAETCAIVGELMLIERTLDESGTDPVAVTAYLSRACDSGSLDACRTLAGELDSGALLPADAPRARDLAARLCRSGEQDACEALAPAPTDRPVQNGDYCEVDGRPGVTRWTEVDGVKVSTCSPGLSINRGLGVTPGYANWVAIIWRPDSVARPYRLLCGGSLIAPGWVLTAAHCLEDEDGRPTVTAKSGHMIRLGVHRPFDEKEGNTHAITGVFKHPGFRPKSQTSTLAWDVALIRIAETPRKRGRVAGRITPVALDTVPLPLRAIRPGMQATVLGFGRTSPNDQATSTALLKGDVYLKDRQSCTRRTFFSDVRLDSVLCASERKGRHNCEGDSGGPLILEGEADGPPVLIGVISGAMGCGEGDKPSRFVRVTHSTVRAWLDSILPAEVRRRIYSRAM